MIKRIVKMSFKPEHINEFKAVFAANRHLIGSFEGCSHLELWQDANNPSIFFTYSFWENESFLNTYRNSELFARVWTQTKPFFNAKPEAWSVSELTL